MKFLCDRCKTRYSIADERVRGKILKIRCKNCSAVITVREGMDEPADWASPAPGDGAPEGTPPSPRAKDATTPPPPPALQEEWYLSLDGHQEGPFALTEAQGWVSAKATDEDLFCWSEGFDDWLPIEKVSHFRGLRGQPGKRPHPPARPPGRGAAPRPTAPEEEARPLFAATLAKIEADGRPALKDASASASMATPTTPASARPSPLGSLAKPTPAPTSLPASAGGPAARPPVPAAGPGKPSGAKPPGAPAVPAGAKSGKAATPARTVPLPSPAAANRAADAAPLAPPPPPTAATPRPGAATATAPPPVSPTLPPTARSVPRFDTGDDDSLGDAARGRHAAGNGKVGSMPPADEDSGDRPAAGDDMEDGDFQIGEVSRVVRLADIVKQTRPIPRQGMGAAAVRNTTGAVPVARGTGATNVLGPTPPSAEADPFVGPPTETDQVALPQFESAVAPARRRRVMLPLLLVVLTVVSVVAVVMSTSGDSGDDGPAGGATSNYENLGFQVDDPRSKRTPKEPVALDAGVSTRPRWTGGGGNGGTGGGNSGTGSTGPATGKGEALLGADGRPLREMSPDEVISMAARMEIGTRRCYERALKDDPFLKVSKIKATLTVKPAGEVSSVVLASMANTPVGICLSKAIQRWKFRPSATGIVSEISLVFEQR